MSDARAGVNACAVHVQLVISHLGIELCVFHVHNGMKIIHTAWLVECVPCDRVSIQMSSAQVVNIVQPESIVAWGFVKFVMLVTNLCHLLDLLVVKVVHLLVQHS